MDHPASILIASIKGVHGVKGLLKLDCFLEDPATLPDFNPLLNQAQDRQFFVELKQFSGKYCLAKIEGIDSREQAQALIGLDLYALRASLQPLPDDNEFYIADLLQLPVFTRDGQLLGIIKQVLNFGAGDILQIEAAKDQQEILIPFTNQLIPLVDLVEKKVMTEWDVHE
ncbi:MAG TPA: ribosome maturation factor RimM [Alphaproteobacteria bacterium]|nr:ribosome maturation factor RimM [Alphaproteobacteria bacterium]